MQSIKRFIFLTAVSLGAALLLAALIVIYELNVFKGLEKLSYARLCCDGLFVSAVIFLGSGILVALRRNGGFDSINFALLSLARRFRHSSEKKLTYFEYVKQRHESKSKSPHPAIMTAGCVTLLAAFVFLAFA